MIAPAPSQPTAKPLRTAVLVIHGIGNQRPLETLRAAADALYTSDPDFAPAAATVPDTEPNAARLWLTFDRDNDERDVDLPVLTTSNIGAPGAQLHYVDFHECYWADLMSETRFVAVPLWLFELVRKGPGGMAQRIRPLWFVILLLLDLWLLASSFPIASAAFWLIGCAPAAWLGAACVWVGAVGAAALCMGRYGLLSQLFLAATGLLLEGVVHHALRLPLAIGSPGAMGFALTMIAVFVVLNARVLQTVVGDAARYYRAAPANIGVRRAIRKLAVDRLQMLHADTRYDRIVVLAHSLGSVIGYDMLRAYWSEHCNRFGNPGNDPMFAAQDSANSQKPGFDADAWRLRAGLLCERLKTLDEPKGKRPWIVSDFVTVGSPLTHADYLSADGTSRTALAKSYRRQCREREMPQNPAWHVGGDGAMVFHLPAEGRSFLHSGAMFSVLRWTNIFFPLRHVISGDVVGGPVADAFGPGVTDHDVPIRGFSAISAHTHYFNTSDPHAVHLKQLRAAVNLRRVPVGR